MKFTIESVHDLGAAMEVCREPSCTEGHIYSVYRMKDGEASWVSDHDTRETAELAMAAYKAFTDSQREVIRRAFNNAVLALDGLWDAEVELEKAVGSEIDGIREWLEPFAAVDGEVDEDTLDSFIAKLTEP